MTPHPGTPRDVDLTAWLDKITFHPANTEAKQVAHEYTRSIIAGIGAALHDVIPASDDKSTAFRLLGDVLMYANRALAVNGGPVDGSTADVASMKEVIAASAEIFQEHGVPGDPRIEDYKATQRGEEPTRNEVVAGTALPQATPLIQVETGGGGLFRLHKLDRYGEASLLVTVVEPDQERTAAEVEIKDAETLSLLITHLLAARGIVWPAGDRSA